MAYSERDNHTPEMTVLAVTEREKAKEFLRPLGYHEIITQPNLAERAMKITSSCNFDFLQIFTTMMCQLDGRIH